MLNNLYKISGRGESRKSSSKCIIDAQENRDQRFSNLTSDMFNEYKTKISNLQKTNQKLLEELEATNRNFDAMNIKYDEAQNLIKRLKDELLKLKSKSNSSILENSETDDNSIKMEDKIKSYQKRIDELLSKNNLLEKKLSESKTKISNIDNELKLKNKNDDTINKLNEDLKNANEKLLKENEILQNKVKNIFTEYSSSKREIIDLSRTINELNQEREKLKTENKLMYNNLEQARQKLMNEILDREKFMKQMKQKTNEDKELNNKIKEYEKQIEELKNELEIEKNNNSFNEMNIKNLMDEINTLKNDKNWKNKLKIKSYVSCVYLRSKPKIDQYLKFERQKLFIDKKVNILSLLSFGNKKNNIGFDLENMDLIGEIQFDLIGNGKNDVDLDIKKKDFNKENVKVSEISLKFVHELKKSDGINEKVKNVIINELNIFSTKNYEIISNIDTKLQTLESKIKTTNEKLNKFKQEIYDYVVMKFNSLKVEKQLLTDKNGQLTSELEINKRKSEYDMKQLKEEMQKKLTKKHEKKLALKKQIEDLQKTIDDMNKKKIDLSEIKKLFEFVSNISSRLNLTFDNLQMTFKCKSCNTINNKLYCLPVCGHSICSACLYEENSNPKILKLRQCYQCNTEILRDEEIPENINLNDFVKRYKYAKQQIESDLEMMVKKIGAYINQ